jgi:4a-hydroxytetrahydrobiopterin dehydratase
MSIEKNNHSENLPTSNWLELNNFLNKEFTFSNFIDAMEFVNKVAKIAEEMQHHPKITIDYNRVLVQTHTHDDGYKVTYKDHQLALEIENLMKS